MDIFKLQKQADNIVKNAPPPEECDKQIPNMVKGMNSHQKRLARFMLIKLLRKQGRTEEEIKVELEKIR